CEAGLCCEILGGIGFRPAFLACVIEGRCLHDHDACGFKVHPCAGKWMSDALVLSDWSTKDVALASICRGAADCGHAKSHRLGRDEDSLGIEPMQDHLEP